MNGYPYPVLAPLEMAYKEQELSVKLDSYSIEKGILNIKVLFQLTSEYLKSLISDNKAKLLFTITNCISKNEFSFNNVSDSYDLYYRENELLSIDTLCIKCTIVSTESFVMSYNSEFSEYYSDDFSFNILPHMILGLSNDIIIEHNLNNNDFIKISASDDVSGIKYSCSGQYINIIVNKNVNNAYARMISNSATLTLLTNDLLVFPALVYVITTLINDGISHYENLDWFKVISQASFKEGKTLKDFVEDSINNGGVPIDEIYEYVQLLMKNSIERDIVTAAESKVK